MEKQESYLETATATGSLASLLSTIPPSSLAEAITTTTFPKLSGEDLRQKHKSSNAILATTTTTTIESSSSPSSTRENGMPIYYNNNNNSNTLALLASMTLRKALNINDPLSNNSLVCSNKEISLKKSITTATPLKNENKDDKDIDPKAIQAKNILNLLESSLNINDIESKIVELATKQQKKPTTNNSAATTTTTTTTTGPRITTIAVSTPPKLKQRTLSCSNATLFKTPLMPLAEAASTQATNIDGQSSDSNDSNAAVTASMLLNRSSNAAANSGNNSNAVASTSKKSQFKIPSDILDDLASRFIINVPEIELSDLIRICFQIELAHWFYLDFFCASLPTPEDDADAENDNKIPKRQLAPCGIKHFAMQIFQHIPFLQQHLSSMDKILENWKNYKLSVPTYGAILLSEDFKYCLLVQSYFAKCSWGFPKGKVNENEDPVHCASREVFEETGYDITKLIVPNEYIEAVINYQYTRLYIVRNVALDTKFSPRTRNEIKCCDWFPIDLLPTNKNDAITKAKLGINANSFFMIMPFVKRLKKWIRTENSNGDGGSHDEQLQQMQQEDLMYFSTSPPTTTMTMANNDPTSVGATATPTITNSLQQHQQRKRLRHKSMGDLECAKLRQQQNASTMTPLGAVVATTSAATSVKSKSYKTKNYISKAAAAAAVSTTTATTSVNANASLTTTLKIKTTKRQLFGNNSNNVMLLNDKTATGVEVSAPAIAAITPANGNPKPFKKKGEKEYQKRLLDLSGPLSAATSTANDLYTMDATFIDNSAEKNHVPNVQQQQQQQNNNNNSNIRQRAKSQSDNNNKNHQKMVNKNDKNVNSNVPGGNANMRDRAAAATTPKQLLQKQRSMIITQTITAATPKTEPIDNDVLLNNIRNSSISDGIASDCNSTNTLKEFFHNLTIKNNQTNNDNCNAIGGYVASISANTAPVSAVTSALSPNAIKGQRIIPLELLESQQQQQQQRMSASTIPIRKSLSLSTSASLGHSVPSTSSQSSPSSPGASTASSNESSSSSSSSSMSGSAEDDNQTDKQQEQVDAATLKNFQPNLTTWMNFTFTKNLITNVFC